VTLQASSSRSFAVLLAFIAAGLMTLIEAYTLLNAAGIDPLDALRNMYQAALGSKYAIGSSLGKAVPRLFSALGIALAIRAGLWNIGAEGQLYLGAAAAAGTTMLLPGLTGIHGPVAGLIAGFLLGALWAVIPGALRAYRGISEVITSLLLVYVAIQIVNYLVEGPWLVLHSTFPATAPLALRDRLPAIWPGTLLNAGFPLALVMTLAVYVLLYKTRFGLWIKAIGDNARASRVMGLPVPMMLVAVMGLSGGFAGLAGAVEVLGTRGRLIEGFSPGYGFEAIAIALLGRLHPAGIVGASLIFGILDAGSGGLQVSSAGMSSAISPIVEGLAVVNLLAILGFADIAIRRYRARQALAGRSPSVRPSMVKEA
jgi:general nucleoside transport system permease protein